MLRVRGCGPYMQQAEDGCDVREDCVHRGERDSRIKVAGGKINEKSGQSKKEAIWQVFLGIA